MNNNDILLVEDNPDDAKLTLHGFRSNKVVNPIFVAPDGVEALDFLHARGAWAERAGERTRLIPVVILTSSEQDEDVISGYSLGANSYVRKPVDFAEFLEAVKTLGVYWLLLNQALPERAAK